MVGNVSFEEVDCKSVLAPDGVVFNPIAVCRVLFLRGSVSSSVSSLGLVMSALFAWAIWVSGGVFQNGVFQVKLNEPGTYFIIEKKGGCKKQKRRNTFLEAVPTTVFFVEVSDTLLASREARLLLLTRQY